MKPDDWPQMTQKQRTAVAEKLFDSPRGKYIVGQALAIARIALEARNEDSNCDDIEILGETLFGIGFRVELQRLLGSHR